MLFDIDVLDELVEMKPMGKEERYTLIKTYCDQYQKLVDIKLQKYAQLTEYFLPKDMFQLIKCIIGGDQIEEFIQSYKSLHFPKGDAAISESAPDWEKEIGGLSYAKEKIEEMFGVAQKYSMFFKG